MLILEASDPTRALPAMGTPMQVVGATRDEYGRLASTAARAASLYRSAVARCGATCAYSSV